MRFRIVIFIYFLIAVDSGFENLHILFENQSKETEWLVWQIGGALRVCLIPIVMLMGVSFRVFEKAIIVSYFLMGLVDVLDWMINENTRDQTPDWAMFVTLNIFIILFGIINGKKR